MRFGGVFSRRWLLFAICSLWVVASAAEARVVRRAKRPLLRDLLVGPRSSRGLRAGGKDSSDSSWTTDPTLSSFPKRQRHRFQGLANHRRLIFRRQRGPLIKKRERRWLQQVEGDSADSSLYLKFAEARSEGMVWDAAPVTQSEMQGHSNASLDNGPLQEGPSLKEFLEREADLSEVRRILNETILKDLYVGATEKGGTLFLPTNAAFASPAYKDFMFFWSGNGMYDQAIASLKAIMAHHVSVEKMISPSDVEARIDVGPLVVPTLDIDGDRNVSMEAQYNKKRKQMYLYVDGILVLDVVQLRSFWVYKIGSFLNRRWNQGETLTKFLEITPGLTFFKNLVAKAGRFKGPANERNGPFTVFIVPDKDLDGSRGEMPACMKEAFNRRANENFPDELLSELLVPGVWTFNDWDDTTQFTTVSGTRVNITQVCQGPSCPVEFLINGAPLVTRAIPLFNGVAHILSRLPRLPVYFNKDFFVWECVNALCNECPNSAEKLLLRLDQKRCGQESNERSPDPGYCTVNERPYWVCRDQEDWIPPGWDVQSWLEYKQDVYGITKRSAKTRALMRYERVHYGLLPTLRKRFPMIARRLRDVELDLAGTTCQNHRRSYMRNFIRNMSGWLHERQG